MTPLSEHQLLVFWLQLVVLVMAARGLGGLMRRVGQPAVIGELAAGLIIGPSLLGRIAPDVYAYLFPNDPTQNGMLLAVAWVGVALLLVVTGFETDLKLLASVGRSSVFVAVGSLVVPLVLGFGVGLVLPDTLIGEAGTQTTFALFIAVALSISALPVVARILMEMDLMRRDIGQVIVAAGMANDLVGWVLLGALAGLVASGGVDVVSLSITILAMLAFLVFMLTLGQRLADAALRRARGGSGGGTASFSVALLIALTAGVVTQVIGVEAVLGMFIAGIVIGRSRYQQPQVTHTIERMTAGFFAPVFFATAGLFVDLGLLLDPDTAWAAVVVIVIAAVAKLLGASIGARLGGMSRIEGLAIGVGLNARGAVEIVIATIGLSLAVLSQASYTIVVVMAMVTSMMAPPLLRPILRRLEASPAEAQRLAREAVIDSSVIAHTRTALLPTRGGANSVLAGRLLDLALQPDAAVTVFTVHDGEGDRQPVEAAREAIAAFDGRIVDHIDKVSVDPAAAITSEARLGYGLLALGMTESFTGHHEASAGLRAVLSRSPVPVMLVRHGHVLPPNPEDVRPRRIVVPATGTAAGQAAQEIAYTLAERAHSALDVVHVVTRPDTAEVGATVGATGAARSSGQSMLAAAHDLAAKFGREANLLTRVGQSAGREISSVADENDADLIVIGGTLRTWGDEPFLGHGIDYVLDHARQTVLVVLFPSRGGDDGDH